VREDNMGAWGPGSFQNDTALDFLEETLRSESTNLVTDALKSADDASAVRHLDIQVAERALAAGELIAASCGRGAGELPEGAVEWVQNHHDQLDEPILALAGRAVRRVVQEAPSLRELWFDSQKAEAWLNSAQDLAGRLAENNSES
jgi:uncharacterized protein DUF4259